MDGNEAAYTQGQAAVPPHLLHLFDGVKSGLEIGMDLQGFTSLETELADGVDFYPVRGLQTISMDICQDRSRASEASSQ